MALHTYKGDMLGIYCTSQVSSLTWALSFLGTLSYIPQWYKGVGFGNLVSTDSLAKHRAGEKIGDIHLIYSSPLYRESDGFGVPAFHYALGFALQAAHSRERYVAEASVLSGCV